jgi:arginyl-tRNA synthetase
MYATLTEKIKDAIDTALRLGGLKKTDDTTSLFRVEVPPEKKFGHFSTNAAMVYAKSCKKPPREIAAILLEMLKAEPLIDSASVEGAGFINLTVRPRFLIDRLREIIRGDYSLPFSILPREPVQVEFVSANPTGPLTIGHGRQAVLGDILSSIFQKAGWDVTREYYFNDAGNQMKLLARSLWVRYNGFCKVDYEIPDGGYHGEYLIAIAEKIYQEIGSRYCNLWDENIESFFLEQGKTAVMEMIHRTLDTIAIKFDTYFTEGSLFTDGIVNEVLQLLKDKEALYEKDLALWFKTSDFKDIEDKVLIRSDGMATYFLTDIAYHYQKYRRGFSSVFDIWGADHHGHISRMQAAMKALGIPEGFLHVILHQMVSLKQNDVIVKMSKRAANFVTLDELLLKVGKDAVRYFFAMVDKDSQMEFNIDLALSKTMDNPVYYVQYAIARIYSLFENAKTKGIVFEKETNLDKLSGIEESFLIRDLLLFPEIIRDVAQSYQIHKLTNYVYSLAYAFHTYYNGHMFVDPNEPEITNARLNLAYAFRCTIEENLRILGVTAPERM